MTEPTVQVPVSLIERAMKGLLNAPGRDAILTCGELHTLLSQPSTAPTAEPSGTDVLATDEEMAEFGEAERARIPEPPQIEYMAPGTTFWGKFTPGGELRQFTRIEGDYPVLIRGVEYRADDIDPSTIRDVTPPKEKTDD